LNVGYIAQFIAVCSWGNCVVRIAHITCKFLQPTAFMGKNHATARE
jgi:hypothetical protein